MATKHIFPLYLSYPTQEGGTAATVNWNGLSSRIITTRQSAGTINLDAGAGTIKNGTIIVIEKTSGAPLGAATIKYGGATITTLATTNETVAVMFFNDNDDVSDGGWEIISKTTLPTSVTSSTTSTFSGAVTFTVGSQNTAVARTATVDGAGTGTVAAGTSFVSVTSAGANNIIVLPTPVVGNSIVLHVGANGYELRTNDVASVTLNNVSGSGVELAVAANVVIRCTCVSATAWISEKISNVGAPAGGGTPD